MMSGAILAQDLFNEQIWTTVSGISRVRWQAQVKNFKGGLGLTLVHRQTFF